MIHNKLIIKVDCREDSNIYNMFPDDTFGIEVTTLNCGDYVCGNVIIERKSIKDLKESIYSGLIFQQAADMLCNSELKSYILVTSSIRALAYAGYNEQNVIETVSSLNRRGVTTLFIENDTYFVQFCKSLFKKHNDTKPRNVNPVRKQTSNEDMVTYLYSCLPGVGPGIANNLKKVFTTPKSLFSATEEQLSKVELIGKTRSKQLHNFFNEGIYEPQR